MGTNNQDDVPEKLRGWDMPDYAAPLANYVSTRESSNRPNIMQGGNETFDIEGPHPGRVGRGGKSTAVGLYGFTKGTWNQVAGEDASMAVPNQQRAFWKHASTSYANNTGRDLSQDLQEKGLTPEIASKIDAAWLGYKDIGGNVLGNIPGGKKISVYDALRMNNAPESALRANMPSGGPQTASYNTRSKMADNQEQVQYGGGQQGPYSGTSRGAEGNIPFQQRAEKVGLLGMLGVQTTPAERLALIKMGGTMMSTVGSPAKALGEGLKTYADALSAYEKQQSELASAHTESKLKEAQARQATAASQKEILNTPSGAISSGVDPVTMENVYKTTEFPDVGQTKVVGSGGGGTSTNKIGGVGVTPSGSVEIDPSSVQSLTSKDISSPEKAAPAVQSVAKKINASFDLGNVYDGTNNSPAEDKATKLDQLIQKNKYPNKQAEFGNYATDYENFKKILGAKQAAYDSMQGNQTNLNTYVSAMARVPKSGEMAPGAGADVRYNIGNVALTAINALGVSDEALKSINTGDGKTAYDRLKDIKDAVVARTEFEKISPFLARQQNPGMQVAAQWLDRTAGSLPNVRNQNEANAILMGNMYAERVRAKDDLNVINHIGRATNNTGYGKTQMIMQDLNNARDYNSVAKISAAMLNPENDQFRFTDKKTGQKYNLVSLYLERKISKEKFNDEARKHFGIMNASRIYD